MCFNLAAVWRTAATVVKCIKEGQEWYFRTHSAAESAGKKQREAPRKGCHVGENMNEYKNEFDTPDTFYIDSF